MKRLFPAVLLSLCCAFALQPAAWACTGIRLTSQDGGVVYGRTMEWGTFDLNSRITIVPRGHEFTAATPAGSGMRWTARYGIVGLDMMESDSLADAMNEKGLAVGMFYHPGFARYPDLDPARLPQTITSMDLPGYVLGSFASVEEARAGLASVRVVGATEKASGVRVEGHWMVTDASGKCLVVEFTGGEMKLFDNPLGVITNAPTFDWHLTNLRNYLNLSPVALPDKKIDDLDFAPLGGGSGMIGLPGDNTPPSRFVRAVAWTSTARKTPTPSETVYEFFRILDNFNIPQGAAEGQAGQASAQGMRSSTIWTTGWDLTGRVLYYHTQHNRRVRRLDINRIDFARDPQTLRHRPLDTVKSQDYQDLDLK